MSNHVYLKQPNGQLIGFLADDNGIIQQAANGDDDFTGLVSGATSNALTADAPTDAAAFTALLNPATELLQGELVAADKIKLNNLQTIGPVALAAPSDTINVTGLNGDREKAYIVRGTIFFGSPASPISVKVQPQGADTNCASQSGDFALGNIISNSVMNLGANNSTAAIYGSQDILVIQGMINAASAVGYRNFNFEMMHMDNTSAIIGRVYMTGVYKDSATNLTSVKFLANQANSFATGSIIKFTAVGA